MDTTRIYRYPNNDMDKHKLWVRFKRIDFEWDEDAGRMIAFSGARQPAVYMYLPGSIELKDGSSYSTSNLGVMGRFLEKGINDAGTNVNREQALTRLSQAGDMVAGGIADGLEQIGSVLAGGSLNPGMVALMMHRFNQGSSGAGGGVRSATRAIANPHTRSMFENVNLRNFSFNFEFIPDSEQDAIHQTEIIKFFRKIAYPSMVAMDVDSNSDFLEEISDQLVYKFPSMVQVDMFYRIDDQAIDTLEQISRQQGGRELETLFNNLGQTPDLVMNSGLWRIGPRIQPCYISDVSQTLDNNNSLMYRPVEINGERRAVPTTQTLTISLQEDRPLSSESIEGGY